MRKLKARKKMTEEELKTSKKTIKSLQLENTNLTTQNSELEKKYEITDERLLKTLQILHAVQRERDESHSLTEKVFFFLIHGKFTL